VKKLLFIALLAATFFGVAGIANASIPNNGVITACYLKSSGSLKVIDPTVTNCKNNETKLEWNQTGPAGPPGQDGANGTNGQDGVSGYEIVTSDRDVSGVSGALGGLSVDCPAGKKALGGGGQYVTSSGVPVSSNVTQIITTAPKADGSGWMITYLVTASPPGDITAVRVYATCVTVL
jgi:hypothetical protein